MKPEFLAVREKYFAYYLLLVYLLLKALSEHLSGLIP